MDSLSPPSPPSLVVRENVERVKERKWAALYDDDDATLQSADDVGFKWNHRAERKDRSISDGEVAEKRQRSPPSASHFSLRRLSLSIDTSLHLQYHKILI